MENTQYDQLLDKILLGPITVGEHQFNFSVDPPDYQEIPQEHWIANMIILLTCQYKGQEFLRVGYFVEHAYSEDINNSNNGQWNDGLNPNLVQRYILTDNPSITTFEISWDE